MDNPLGTINHHHDASRMGERDGVGQIRAATGDVRHLPECQNAAARGNELREALNVWQ
ncbi:hypothetical protein SDC9_165240 [bioreactor metagenome]|uniref:Uncharacterized protein n=1 Tax=bioreactor metagenome TaxID=1076179 RepID=A0A645FTU7_9ZZZZ